MSKYCKRGVREVYLVKSLATGLHNKGIFLVYR